MEYVWAHEMPYRCTSALFNISSWCLWISGFALVFMYTLAWEKKMEWKGSREGIREIVRNKDNRVWEGERERGGGGGGGGNECDWEWPLHFSNKSRNPTRRAPNKTKQKHLSSISAVQQASSQTELPFNLHAVPPLCQLSSVRSCSHVLHISLWMSELLLEWPWNKNTWDKIDQFTITCEKLKTHNHLWKLWTSFLLF